MASESVGSAKVATELLDEFVSSHRALFPAGEEAERFELAMAAMVRYAKFLHLQREVLFVLRAGHLVSVVGHVFEERGDDALRVHRQADQGSLEVE